MRLNPSALRNRMKRTHKKPPSAAVKAYWDSLPNRCEACRTTQNIVLHHILANAPGKQGRRDDMVVVKICPECHNCGRDSVHGLGSEAAFYRQTRIDLVAIAVQNRDEWLLRNA